MQIPLFPLRTVLFPGMALPLRVFEERYKVMVRELLESDGVFGVLLIREGQESGGEAVPFDVGTTARIERAVALDGGRFALSARGAQRFRVTRLLSPRPYPFGEVELIDDAPGVPTPRLTAAMETVRTTFPAYFRLALSLSDQWAKGLKLPSEPHRMVNYIAPWLQVSEEVKQRLLEIELAPDRVAHLAEVIDDLLTRTREEVTDYRRRKFRSLGAQN
ncbi:MAG: LON peptidase substrate-binding domain-containing protein [Tepidiformaceae bacterium]